MSDRLLMNEYRLAHEACQGARGAQAQPGVTQNT
jgi:hypothetical protein